MDRLCGKRMLVTHLVLKRMEAEEKAHGERRTCAQACSGWQVRNMVNLYAFFDAEKLQAGADGRVLDGIIASYILNSRI
jgi:hypothetical protein